MQKLEPAVRCSRRRHTLPTYILCVMPLKGRDMGIGMDPLTAGEGLFGSQQLTRYSVLSRGP